VTGEQMSRVRTICAPVPQNRSGASHLRSCGSISRSARVTHADIHQGGIMGWGRGHPQVNLRHRCYTSRSVTRISTRIAAHGNRAVSEILHPVIVLAPAHAVAAHGVVDVCMVWLMYVHRTHHELWSMQATASTDAYDINSSH
jgi:hypothetical protein